MNEWAKSDERREFAARQGTEETRDIRDLRDKSDDISRALAHYDIPKLLEAAAWRGASQLTSN